MSRRTAKKWSICKIDPVTGQIVTVNFQDEIKQSIGDAGQFRACPRKSNRRSCRTLMAAASGSDCQHAESHRCPYRTGADSTIQQVYQTGTGGTFTLTVNGKTAAIDYNATAAMVQKALEDANVAANRSSASAQFDNIGHSRAAPRASISMRCQALRQPSCNEFPCDRWPVPQWPGGPSDYFMVRLTGSIFIPTTGTYSFSTTSDDGSVLYLDGLRFSTTMACTRMPRA